MNSDTGRVGGGVIFSFLVLFVVYIGFYVHARDELAELTSTLIGTGVGAGLAVATGLWLFRHQQREIADSRREDFRGMLREELEETRDELKDSIAELDKPDSDVDTIYVHMIYVQPLVIEEAAKSGLFSSAFTRQLLSVARQFHTYNLKVSNLYTIPGVHAVSSPLEQELVHSAAKGIANQAQAVVERCERLLRHSDLSSSTH